MPVRLRCGVVTTTRPFSWQGAGGGDGYSGVVVRMVRVVCGLECGFLGMCGVLCRARKYRGRSYVDKRN